MKKFLSIASLVIGIAGLSVFLEPVVEIICGVVGLCLALFAKDPNAGHIIDGIRYWGRNIAWINIAWVCLEVALKFVGIDIF